MGMRNLNSRLSRKNRKLKQDIRGNKLKASGMEFRRYIGCNVKELLMEQFNATSCIINITDTTKSFGMQHACNSSSSSIGLKSYQEEQGLSHFIKRNSNKSPSFDNIESIISADEKVHVFNQASIKALEVEDVTLVNIIDLEDGELSSYEEPKGVRRPAFSLLMFKGEYLSKFEVPISPSFQAEIPDLIERNDYIKDDAFGNSRWLGSRVWPTEGHCTEKCQEVIRKGDFDYCSCEFLRSLSSIK